MTDREARSGAFTRLDRRLVIALDQEAPDHWIVDVSIDGLWVGDGTAPTASGALDVAMSVLYGDTNDHLNGDEGAIRALEDASVAQDQHELVREAFGRCSPSACWSVWGDLARGGITDRKAWDYPIGHLQRLAAELSVIFGQQAPERLREVGVDEARIERLKEALS